MKFLLFASLLAVASAVFHRPTRGERRRLPNDGASKKSKGDSSDDECDVRLFTFFADRSNVAPYFLANYANGVSPQPGDSERFHFPIYDGEAFENDGVEILIGYGAEKLEYVPFADFTELECVGNWILTFQTPSGDFEGQVTSDWTCFIGFEIDMLQGGIGTYQGASGFVELVFKSDGFFEGVGHSTWKVVNCA